MKWITVAEAAQWMGYSRDGFRRKFCDPSRPLLTTRTMPGRGGRPCVKVLEAEVERLLEEAIQRPA